MKKYISNHIRSCVQLINDSFDIVHNPKVQEKYPALYDAVIKHNRTSVRSYYNFTAQAHREWLAYQQDYSIGYYMEAHI